MASSQSRSTEKSLDMWRSKRSTSPDGILIDKHELLTSGSIINYTALLGYASRSFTRPAFGSPTPDSADTEHASDQWFQDFRRIISEANVTSHEITSLLAMLSSSITNGQPLPPYLHAPPGYQLSKKLELVDHDILSLRHIAEPGYAAFAVMAISTRCIHMDIEKLLA